jgi:hypothetical protein
MSWNGVAILAHGADPVESRRGLPGDPEDKHSRHIEALINGVSLSTHRQSSARPEVRLQTAMVGTLDEHPEELLSAFGGIVHYPRACARDLRSRMDPESASGGAMLKSPANPVRARNWQVHR